MRALFFTFTLLFSLAGLVGLAFMHVGGALAQHIGIASMIALCLLLAAPGKTANLFFATLSAWITLHYLGWRLASLPLHFGRVSAILACLLLVAELYGATMMLLNLFVNARPLEREPQPLPDHDADYPTVDIYIPTYSEPLSVVAPTLMGALEVDYPRSRFNVYILDDGWPRSQTATDRAQARELVERTAGLKALCEKHGAHYLTRTNNEHAKSGNLNSAMTHTRGELLLILDADHVPTTDILRNTVGFFLQDTKLAVVQTPHFFLNPDPVEKNLRLFNKMPGENDLFYRVVQKGLDLWNTSFFCGSAALIRRKAVESVNGFSYDSITEDASTSVKMHQKGWRTSYFGKPMVAGLQPETFSGFTLQRLRWAMGMAQILVKQNPLLVKGLSLGQRFSYISVLMFWFFPFARVMFFTAPLLSIFWNLRIYPPGVDNFLTYTIPYLAAALMSTEKAFGRVRRIFMSEVYETLQAFYTLPALISTLMRPNKPTFKVTPKGEKLDRESISEFHRPFYAFFMVTLIGLGWVIKRLILEPDARYGLMMSGAWLLFNLFLLLGAFGTLLERVQRRARPRIDINEPVAISGDFGVAEAVLVDANEKGALVKAPEGMSLDRFALQVGAEQLPAHVMHHRTKHLPPNHFAVLFKFDTPAQERLAVKLAYGRSERWEAIWKNREGTHNILASVADFFLVAVHGTADHLAELYRQQAKPAFKKLATLPARRKEGNSRFFKI